MKPQTEKSEIECDFCGKKGNWINVLRDTQIVKKDGSDLVLCDDCINNYMNRDYDRIKLKGDDLK